jgi:hypothetical protein
VASGQYARAQTEQQLEPLHRRLADFNRARHAPSLAVDWQARLREEHDLRTLEGHVIEAERQRVAHVIAKVPTQPRDLADWLEGLRETSARQGQTLYHWLAESADRNAVCWYLSQEAGSGEMLEDLFALTQLQLPWRSKLEAGRCYWDEMGQGQPAAMHARILEGINHEVAGDTTEPCVVETLARGNLMIGLASNRHYAYQAIGALGALELVMSGSARLLSAALRRLGFSLQAVAYFASRSQLSLLRSHSWIYDVIVPLVAQDARVAPAIAEGALLRLSAEARCIRRYERELYGTSRSHTRELR